MWLVCAFSSHSNHHLLFSLIFTRRRPISSQGHGLIDFYFHSIFPWSLLSCQPSGTKLQKGGEKTPVSSPRRRHKSLRRRPQKRSSSLRQPKGQNNKCRFNWDSPHRQNGQNVTFWQRRPSWRDKLIYISGNKARAACVQREKGAFSPTDRPSSCKRPAAPNVLSKILFQISWLFCKYFALNRFICMYWYLLKSSS